LVVKAAIENKKSNKTKPAKYINHFRSPLLILEIIKNADNIKGESDEISWKILPNVISIPGSLLINDFDMLFNDIEKLLGCDVEGAGG
jgi:hypothetical protein